MRQREAYRTVTAQEHRKLAQAFVKKEVRCEQSIQILELSHSPAPQN